MGHVTETEADPGLQVAISADPDLLVVQLPAIAAVGGGQAHDAMKALFRAVGSRTSPGSTSWCTRRQQDRAREGG